MPVVSDGMPSLRRRGLLLPILPWRELSDNETDPFSVLYISSCQERVSNDPLSPSYVYKTTGPCNITSFDCFKERGLTYNTTNATGIAKNTTGVSALVVSFQYELWTQVGADFNQTLRALEGSILEHLASFTGLDTCATQSVVSSINRQSSNRRLQSLTSNELGYFVGVGSAPADMIDEKFDTCIVPVQSSSISDSGCEPMIGAITAFITADLIKEPVLEENLRNGILQVIKQGMIDDVYASGSVSKVSFIGTRADDGGASSTSDRNVAFNTDSGEDAGVTSIGIAFIAVGSILVLSLLSIFITRRRRRKETFQKDLVFVDATIAPRELAADGNCYIYCEGAIVPGSLAAVDSLALKPKVVTTNENDMGTSPESATTETLPCSPNSIASDDAAMQSPTKPFHETDHIIDTSSLDGANEDEILDRLHDIADTEEGPLDSSSNGDDV